MCAFIGVLVFLGSFVALWDGLQHGFNEAAPLEAFIAVGGLIAIWGYVAKVRRGPR